MNYILYITVIFGSTVLFLNLFVIVVKFQEIDDLRQEDKLRTKQIG